MGMMGRKKKGEKGYTVTEATAALAAIEIYFVFIGRTVDRYRRGSVFVLVKNGNSF